MAAGAKPNCANGYPSSKHGSLSKDSEISPDLHLKMCKKIAQLTKVSFLNIMFFLFNFLCAVLFSKWKLYIVSEVNFAAA